MPNDFISSAQRTIALESRAVSEVAGHLDEHFCRACEIILASEGRVIVTGMGKSGHIGNKIAATLASTGTPSFFVHPAEASHGDLGMITRQDIVLALSNSGTTAEIVSLLPLIKRLAIKLISITGNPESTLSQAADANLNTAVSEEACPLNLAPTSSTTAQLVMGDALAIALLERKGFSAEDFAFSHPGGALGRKLLLKVGDVMQGGDDLPIVSEGSTVKDALFVMTDKGLGMTVVVDAEGSLTGVFTDGDLRRAMDKYDRVMPIAIEDVMTATTKTVSSQILAAEALAMMENWRITSLVVAERNKPTGVIHLHALLRAGIA
jgi:arabinose-5-phosphate isomerase